MSQKKELKLGGHLRMGEGMRFVAVEARALGYNIVQVMLGPQTDWRPYDISDHDAAEYRKMMYGIETYVHLPFCINPCDRSRKGFCKATFRKFVAVARLIGAKAVIIHPGFKKELSEVQAYDNYIDFFENLMEDDAQLDVFMETDSGSKNGSAVGDIQFIGDALDDLKNPRYGMCLDTEHMYARGVNLWEDEVLGKTLDEYGTRIKMVHLNVPDPNVAIGSYLDRHNSTFDSFPLDSTNLVKKLASRYPLILERGSLAVQEADAKYVRALLKEPVAAESI